MKLRAALAVIGLAMLLAGCEDLGLFGDDAPPPATFPNGCSAAGCAQAPQFCTARGYTPGTEAFHRCVVSVEENLRKGQ